MVTFLGLAPAAAMVIVWTFELDGPLGVLLPPQAPRTTSKPMGSRAQNGRRRVIAVDCTGDLTPFYYWMTIVPLRLALVSLMWSWKPHERAVWKAFDSFV